MTFFFEYDLYSFIKIRKMFLFNYLLMFSS